MLTNTLRRTALAVMSVGLLVLPSDAHAVSACTYDAIVQAVAAGGTHRLDCDGTISFPQAIVVPAGRNVRFEGSGSAVTFDGRGLNRLFEIDGIMTLVGVTLANGRADGANGSGGTSGSPGSVGSNGARGDVEADIPPEPGGSGGSGTAGGTGGAGGAGRGGALLVRGGGRLVVMGGAIRTSLARGGRGGSAGAGGTGGSGGRGGDGDSDILVFGPQTGGSGGPGGSGGAGGVAGPGGSGEGGAIYNLGNVLIGGTAFLGNTAQGGQGGTGGVAGSGGLGGTGGEGGFGGDYGSAAGGVGGTGGDAGGGVPGVGGRGAGGAIAGTGTLTVLNARLEQNRALGGAPGTHAPATAGGTGGTGGTGGAGDIGSEPARGGAGGTGGTGTSQTVGGDGGAAIGGAVYMTGTLRPLLTGVLLLDNRAIGASSRGGGTGGRGGSGGLGGPAGYDMDHPPGWEGDGGDGGAGGNGGVAGRSGDARGGAISSAPAAVRLGDWTPGANTAASLSPYLTGSLGGAGGPGGAAGPTGGSPGDPGPVGADAAPGGEPGTAGAPTIDGATEAAPHLQVGPASLPAAIAGTPYTATFTAVGGTPPYEFKPFGMPPGLGTNVLTGQVNGTPTRAGVHPVQAYVRDATPGDFMYGARTVTLVVAPKLTSLSPATGPAGTSVTVTGAGFAPGSTVSFGSAPPVSATDITPTSLKAIVPAGSGRVLVTVVSNGVRSLRVYYQYP